MIDLDALDAESLAQLRTMLDQHGDHLTPVWRAVRIELSSRQSGFLPTPNVTPQRPLHFRSASDFDYAIDVPPRPSFRTVDSHSNQTSASQASAMAFDPYVEGFFTESAATCASATVFDDAVESFFAGSALSDDDDDTDRGRAADRRRRGSSCNRGGVVPPPGMIHFAHAQQRVQQARAHDQAMQGSDEGGTSTSQTSNPSATQHSTPSVGSTTTAPPPQSHVFSFMSPIQPSPFAYYDDPYFRPIDKALIAAVTRLCGKASRLLYDEAYTNAWEMDIQRLLGISALPSGASEDAMSTLAGLGKACLEAHRDEDHAKFVGVLASLSLAAKVQALMEKDNVTSLQRVWEVYMLPLNPSYSFSKWERWFVKGKRWALVGQAGGIYLTLLIIFARETSTFENVNVTHMVNMGYHIRAPRPGLSLTRLFASTLAPSIKLLQDTFPVDSCRLFDNETLRVMKIDSSVRLEDWVSSDTFFKAFKTNTFHLPSRDLTFWARGAVVSPVYTSVSLGSLLPLHDHDDIDSTLSQELEDRHDEDPAVEATSQRYWTDVLDALAKVEGKDHLKVKTSFRPDHPRNKFKLRAPTRKKTLEFTKAERALAECAYVPKDFKDFSNRLASQLAPGYREEPSHYVLLDRTVIMANDPNKFAHIGGHDGLPFAISLPPAPKEYADIIIPMVEEIFPSILRTRDSNDGHRFFVLHHTFYNRSATRGTDAPSSGDPWKQGKNGKKRIDPSQCLPRLSTEGQDERLETLKKALQGLMDWLTAQLLILLKEHYTVLDAYITVLPGPSAPAVYPFGGMVLNFNVSTLAHRDHGDKRICLVLAAQDGEGGDIVLYEPGLVVRMYTGHSLVFRSCDITHFNLPYKGKRISFVFHSDHDGTAWVDNRNGWKTKEYFSG